MMFTTHKCEITSILKNYRYWSKTQRKVAYTKNYFANKET